MAARLSRIFKIWQLALKNRFMERMVYRLNFFLMTVAVVMQMILTLAFVRVIYGYINNLSGWNYHQALMVAASYMIIEGLLWATCSYLMAITVQVRTGTLDILMVKPMDTQILVSIWQGDPEDWARVVTAIAIFIYVVPGLHLSGMAFAINLGFYLYLIVCAYLILYSITLVIRSLSFWLTDSGNLFYIAESITRMSQYPTDIFFQRFAKIFFSSIIPIAFIATVPAKIFIFGPDWRLMLYATCLAAIFTASSRMFWKFALKHYTSASS
jgi:ABC-2 type transport system permease protein